MWDLTLDFIWFSLQHWVFDTSLQKIANVIPAAAVFDKYMYHWSRDCKMHYVSRNTVKRSDWNKSILRYLSFQACRICFTKRCLLRPLSSMTRQLRTQRRKKKKMSYELSMVRTWILKILMSLKDPNWSIRILAESWWVHGHVAALPGFSRCGRSGIISARKSGFILPGLVFWWKLCGFRRCLAWECSHMAYISGKGRVPMFPHLNIYSGPHN